MNRDDIIRMAREAQQDRNPDGWGFHFDEAQLERFFHMAQAAEREACAHIAKNWDKDHPDTNYGVCIAEAIKARSNT